VCGEVKRGAPEPAPIDLVRLNAKNSYSGLNPCIAIHLSRPSDLILPTSPYLNPRLPGPLLASLRNRPFLQTVQS
jgi:hypothetical protein